MTYATKTADRVNAPNYYCTIEGITGKVYAVHPVKGATDEVVCCMDYPAGNAQSLSPMNNRATIGELRLRFIDVDREWTDLLSTEKASPTLPTIINRNVTVFGAYRDEPVSEYTPMFSGEIREVKLVAPLTFEVIVAERKRRYEENLMASATTVVTTELEQDATQGYYNMKVRSTEGFVVGNWYVLHRQNGSQYEKVQVAAIDEPNTFLTFASPLNYSWGLLYDTLTSAPFVRGNIVNVWYALLTGTFDKTGASNFPLIDYGNNPEGLGISPSEIDLAGLAATRDQFLSNFDVDFLWDAPVTARSFFEAEIYPLAFWPTVNGSGLLGLRVFVPPGPVVEVLAKVYKEHMNTFPQWERRIEEHVNQVKVSIDFNLAKSRYAGPLTFESTSDQSVTKQVKLYEIRSSGLRSALNGNEIAQEVAARVLNRYRIPPVLVTAPLIFTKRGLQLGDMVRVSHDALLNVRAGTMGLSDQIFEVVEVNPDYRRALIDVKLLDTTFRRYAYIGPMTMADYGAATAAEKLYAYWGDTNNKVNAGAEDGYYTF